MQYELKKPEHRDAGIRAGQKIQDLMWELNREDILPLCLQQSTEPDSVYARLSEAVEAIFRQLGVRNTDLAMTCLADGNSFRAALHYALQEQQAGDES